VSYTVTICGAVLPPCTNFKEAVGTVAAAIAKHARAAAEIGDHADAGVYFETGAQVTNSWWDDQSFTPGHQWRVHGPGHAATWFQITKD
jgi:hypothetical protein